MAKSYMFVCRTSEHYKEKPVILYQYGKTRSKSNIQKFLEGFSGTLVSDAFSGYKSLDKNDENTHSAFCWDHTRRDYADALKALKGDAKELAHDTVAHKVLVQIAAIYKAEANSRGTIYPPPEKGKTSCGSLLCMGSRTGSGNHPQPEDPGEYSAPLEPGVRRVRATIPVGQSQYSVQ